jgi:hypothetical protein
MRGSGTYRFVEGPRLQQRSVKRDAATPARRKMSVVTQNPMVVFGGGGLGELLRRLLLLAPSRWIARSGRETRQVLQGKEMVGLELLPATSRACFFFFRKTGIEFYIKVLVVTAQILQ